MNQMGIQGQMGQYNTNNQMMDQLGMNSIINQNNINNQMEMGNQMNQNSIQLMEAKDKRIKELEDTIKKINTELIEEQNKNQDLIKENKYLQNKLDELQVKINNQNNNKNVENDYCDKNEIIKLYKKIEDLNEVLKRYPYFLEKNEKLISVVFTSVDQKTHYSLICKNTHTINNLEAELYKENPDYCYSDNYYLCKGKLLNKFQTFESNHIKNGDIIIINKND